MNKLAIVIPYYKIDFFEETLQSIAVQTDKRFTLYIGNDVSPNNPQELIDKYFPEGNYHYYDYKENIGEKNLALQWERILKNVTEEWFQILGDDDTIAYTFVEEFYKILPEVYSKKINLIKTGILWIDEKENIIENNVYSFDIIPSQDLFIKKYKHQIRSSLSENIYKTELAQKYKFPKISLAWGSDDLSLLLFSENGNIKYIPKPLVKVRVFANSISGSDKMNHQKEYAYLCFKELLFTKYTKYLPPAFIQKELPLFLDEAYFAGYVPKYKSAFCLIKLGNIKNGLSQLKKIYYINKKYGS